MTREQMDDLWNEVADSVFGESRRVSGQGVQIGDFGIQNNQF